jgi:lactoylglutathione lyase
MNPPLYGTITFFYYKDMKRAETFYKDTLGFEKVIDVGFAKAFKVADNIHVGIVDTERGHLQAAENKPVMLTWFTEDVEAWYRKLVEAGVDVELPPKKVDYLGMKTMLFRDPEGYTLEVLEWLIKPYGK